MGTRKNTAESHIATLIEQARPDLGAALIADMVLGCRITVRSRN